MSSTISLSHDERNTLLDYFARSPNPELRQHHHIILLLAEGHAWLLITAVLFCSSRTVARWKNRFEQGRVPALLGLPVGSRPFFSLRWGELALEWVTKHTPRAFGFLRSRWSCAVIVLLLWRSIASRSARRRCAAGCGAKNWCGDGPGPC